MKNIVKQKPDKKVADELIKKFQQIDADLQTALVNTSKQKEEISKATKAYIDAEVEKILKSINREEINRGGSNKRGQMRSSVQSLRYQKLTEVLRAESKNHKLKK